MKKTFDELYGEFMKGIIKVKIEQDKIDKSETQEILDMLSSVEDLEEEINKLGDPDKIEFFNEDEVFYEKRTWKTKYGDLVKIIISDEPNIRLAPKPKKTLQSQLDEAIENEDFEKAVELRDKINQKKLK